MPLADFGFNRVGNGGPSVSEETLADETRRSQVSTFLSASARRMEGGVGSREKPFP